MTEEKNYALDLQKNTLKNEKVRDMFSANKSKHQMITRKHKKFHEKISTTNRYKKSAIPYMTRLLNEENEKRNQFMKY